MRIDSQSIVARLMNAAASGKALLAGSVRRLIEARRRRIAHEREFYRNLDAYCRAHDVPCVCEDDWKTGR
jgi:hypothetical protein